MASEPLYRASRNEMALTAKLLREAAPPVVKVQNRSTKAPVRLRLQRKRITSPTRHLLAQCMIKRESRACSTAGPTIGEWLLKSSPREANTNGLCVPCQGKSRFWLKPEQGRTSSNQLALLVEGSFPSGWTGRPPHNAASAMTCRGRSTKEAGILGRRETEKEVLVNGLRLSSLKYDRGTTGKLCRLGLFRQREGPRKWKFHWKFAYLLVAYLNDLEQISFCLYLLFFQLAGIAILKSLTCSSCSKAQNLPYTFPRLTHPTRER